MCPAPSPLSSVPRAPAPAAHSTPAQRPCPTTLPRRRQKLGPALKDLGPKRRLRRRHQPSLVQRHLRRRQQTERQGRAGPGRARGREGCEEHGRRGATGRRASERQVQLDKCSGKLMRRSKGEEGPSVGGDVAYTAVSAPRPRRLTSLKGLAGSVKPYLHSRSWLLSSPYVLCTSRPLAISDAATISRTSSPGARARASERCVRARQRPAKHKRGKRQGEAAKRLLLRSLVGQRSALSLCAWRAPPPPSRPPPPQQHTRARHTFPRRVADAYL